MKEKIVILRSGRASTQDPFRGPFAFPFALPEGGAELSVEVHEIDRGRIPSLTRDAGVQAVAPVIPMKLIAPVGESQDTATPAAQEVAWGVKAVGADTSPFTGNGTVVAVLDTGIDASHPAFAGVEIIQKDFTGEGNGDQHGHGTHCAGTIFGRTTNNTRIGVAPGVKKALIGKVLGTQGGPSDQVANSILWAVENGAQVISMSLGMDFPGFAKWLHEDLGMPPELATSRALEGYRANVQLFERLASYIRSLGAFSQASLIVAAAGNESHREINPDFEVAAGPPAVSEGIVSVAALGQGGRGLTVPDFSNSGANVSGPGVRIVSAKRGGGLCTMSGTSMATPHVAGVAALWAEKIRRSAPLSFSRLTSCLINSARTDVLEPGFHPFDVGTGLVRAPQEP